MPTDSDRLERLERAVLDLRRDLDALRTALDARVAPAAEPPAVPSVAPSVGPTVASSVAETGPLPDPADRGLTYNDFVTRAAAFAEDVRLPPPRTRLGASGAGSADVEALVGRYGTVAVAALLILMAAGAFLTWAAANFDLSPTIRVALGAVGAVALAGVGLWLRARPAAPGDAPGAREGTRRYGDGLLALALAVTHVDAWAAGPYLGIVRPATALTAAAAASLALAALAWQARQASLFMLGVGGALIAPFVTGSAATQPDALRLYGWVVLSSALLALPRDSDVTPRWHGAWLLLAAGGAVYTFANFDASLAMGAIGNPAGLALPGWMLQRHMPAVFALACAAAPLARAAVRTRGTRVTAAVSSPDAALALVHLTTATVALFGLAVSGAQGTLWLTGVAFVATLLVYATLAVWPAARAAASDLSVAPYRTGPTIHGALGMVALCYPLALLSVGLLGLPRVTGASGAATAVLWGSVAAIAAWRAARALGLNAPLPRPALPSAHAAAASLATALVPVFLFSRQDLVRVALLAGHAAVAIQLLRLLQHPLALLAPGVVAGAAAAWAWVLLDARVPFMYPPFLTRESVVAGTAVAAWVVIARRVWRDGAALLPRGERRFVVAVAAGVALAWGRQELAHVGSADVSTVLLVVYFAAAGIAAIALGRVRQAPAARQVGLALALYAAAKALLQASQIDAVGLRVASYLVVGGFLLGVGYWYRAAGTAHGGVGSGDAPPDPTPAV